MRSVLIALGVAFFAATPAAAFDLKDLIKVIQINVGPNGAGVNLSGPGMYPVEISLFDGNGNYPYIDLGRIPLSGKGTGRSMTPAQKNQKTKVIINGRNFENYGGTY